MIRVHMSIKQYNLLCKYDSFLKVRVDNVNRYYILFLVLYKDYFVYKLLNKLMTAGYKNKACSVLIKALSLLKKSIGFQPFFCFKHIVFRMRQIFRVVTVKVRERITYVPVFLQRNKQVAYGITNLVDSAKQLHYEERFSMSHALYIVFLNCFFKLRKKYVSSNKK